MPSNVYCPFCGIILLSDPCSDDHLEPPPPGTRPWYAEVRGIYSTNIADGDVTITGVGIVRRRTNLGAPIDANLSYIDVDIAEMEEWNLCGPSESRWCFGFHNSCWKLLLLRLGLGQGDYLQRETAIAKSVFFQLYCTPFFRSSWFEFGHDYKGAAQTHKAIGRPTAVDLSSHFYADPCMVPSMDELEAIAPDFRNLPGGPLSKGQVGGRSTSATAEDVDCCTESAACAFGPSEPNGDQNLVASSDDTGIETQERMKRPKQRIFDALSLELKFEIISYLSFNELLNMRLVCRDIALLTTVARLPQSYWESRFLLTQEADFVFPNLTDRRDWRRAFFGTRASLRAACLSMVNRKRIRQLLEPIATLAELEAVFQNGPYGSLLRPEQIQSGDLKLVDSENAENSSQSMELPGSFSGQLAVVDADSPLREGCRVLYYRAQSITPSHGHHRQHLSRIGISTVKMGVRNFISGISLLSSEDCKATRRLTGYHNPVSERWIEILSISHVQAFCVAFCAEGLTGIKFIYTNSDSTDWIGDSIGPGVAQGTLRIPERTERCCLLVGLDRFKIVSLGLCEMADCSGAPVIFCSEGVRDPSRLESLLWTPHPPRHAHLSISPLLPPEPSQVFEPLLNIDFGGPSGVLLGSVARLTLHMESPPRPIIGIEVFHNDGRSVLFGSEGGCAISLFVNSSKGERINEMCILEHNREYYPTISLGGFQVFLSLPHLSVRMLTFG